MGVRMEQMKTDFSKRRYDHINRGERVFLPQWRMRRIRFEESVARAEAKRKGIKDPTIVHLDCHCGSVDCLGTACVKEMFVPYKP